MVHLAATGLFSLLHRITNTIFAPKIQVFVIKIAPRQEGYNKTVYISICDKEGEKGDNGGEDGGKKGADRGGEEEKEKDKAYSREEK